MSEAPPAAVFQLRLLGSPGLSGGDDEERWLLRQRKRLGLLAYLAAQPEGQGVERDVLTYLFWPRLDDSRARNALNQSLHALRRALGDDLFVSEGSQIRVDSGHLTSDLVEFRREIQGERPTRALDLYGGDFLDGFHVSGLREFEDWVTRQRSSTRRTAADAAWKGAAMAEASGLREEALAYAERAVELAPTAEESSRRLMALHAAYGDRAAALRAYEDLRARLEQELGTRPSHETRSAAEALRRGEESDELRTPLQVLSGSEEGWAVDRGPRPPREDRTRRAGPAKSGGGDEPRPGDDGRDSARDSERAPRGQGGTASGRSTTRSGPLRPRLLVAAAAVTLVVVLVVLDSPRSDATPVPGSLGVVLTSHSNPRQRSRIDAVGGEILSLLTTADFLSSVHELGVSASAGLGVDGDGERDVEATLLLEAGDGAVRAALVTFEGELLGSVSLSDSLDAASAADRAVGLVALHMDRRLASWAEASSVVPGWAAFQGFHEALVIWQEMRPGQRSTLQRVVDQEPWFPLALLELALIERLLGEDSLMVALSERRPELSEAEGAFLTLLEARERGQLHEAREASLELADLVPERFLKTAVDLSVDLGRYDEAIRLSKRPALERSIPPNPHWGRVNSLHALGRHDEEGELTRRLRRDHPEERVYAFYEAMALAALGRNDDLRALLRERAGRPEPAYTFGDLGVRRDAVRELFLHGYEAEAKLLVEEAVDFLDGPAGQDVGPAVRARFYRWAGRLDEAEQIYRSLLKTYADWPGRFIFLGQLGLLAADRGDRRAALDFDRQLAGFYQPPEPASDLFKARALIHTRLGDHDPAVHLLERALAAGLSHVQIRTGYEFAALRGHSGFDRLVSAPTF